MLLLESILSKNSTENRTRLFIHLLKKTITSRLKSGKKCKLGKLHIVCHQLLHIRLVLHYSRIISSWSPKLARVAQREKMINKFWLDNLIWEYLCDSKLQRMKFSFGAFWRYQHACIAHSAQIRWLYLPVYQSKILLVAILNHINLTKTYSQVRICWSFFTSELTLPTWVCLKMIIFHDMYNRKIGMLNNLVYGPNLKKRKCRLINHKDLFL